MFNAPKRRQSHALGTYTMLFRLAPLLLCFCISGCAATNYWLIPREQAEIDIPADISTAMALDIYEQAALQNFFSYNPGVTFRNEVSSEVGHWRKGNIGYSSKAVIKNDGSSLVLTVKGTNAYYADLPVVGDVEGEREWVEFPVKHTLNKIVEEIQASWDNL